MKKVLATVILLCFLLTSIGIVSIAAETVEYDTYTLTGTFEGASKGSLISVFILEEGYKMEDLSAVSGSVMDKVLYTNMFEAGEAGVYSIEVRVPKGTSRNATCVLTCNGVKQEDTLRGFLVSSGSLVVYYASPTGKSKNNGTKESPYDWKTVRSKALSAAKTTDTEILLLGGKYSVEDTRIQFSGNEANAGTGHRITFAAASKDDKPVFTSMKEVNHQYITKLTEGDVYNRIPEKSRGMIYKLDMDAAGFADNQGILDQDKNEVWYHTGKTYSVLTMGYDSSAHSIEPPILYLNGKRQMMSQYPNEETVAFDNVVNVTGKNADGYSTLSYAQFTDEMDFGKWTNAIDDAFIAGYLLTSYHGSAAKITAVDTENKKITLDIKNDLYYPNATFNPRFGPRVAIVNLPEEMDIPGEYYFDVTNKDIYYYAPYELTADDVFEMANDRRNQYNSTLGGYAHAYPQIVHMTGAENITFDGIEFYGSRFDNAIYVGGGSTGIEFKNCTVHGASENGINIPGNNNVVSNCNVYDVGRAGISFGGNVNLSENISKFSESIVENCHVYNYAQNPTFSSYLNGIILRDSASDTKNDDGTYSRNAPYGDTIQNNLIHASKHAGAIRYSGVMSTVKRNEMYNVLDSVDDLGVVYIGRTLNEFRNSLTENYIHDFSSTANPRYSVMGVYWDDYQSGQDGTRNIIVGKGVNESGKHDDTFLGIRSIGYDNRIKNNIFVDLNIGLGLSGRDAEKSAADFKKYSHMYALENYLPKDGYEYNDEMIAFREILKASAWKDYDGDGEIDIQMVHMAKAQNNLTVDCGTGVYAPTSTSRIYQYGTENVNGNVENEKSIFVNPAKQDYRVKKEYIEDGALSEVPNELNFDMDWIGIQTTERPDADQSFKLMHPTKNESITKDSIILTWEKALFADKYEFVIATDESFAETSIVERGETKESFVIPTATFVDGTKYYWKVKAINFSRNMGSEWMCDNAESFTIAKAADLVVVESKALTKDNSASIWSFEGVKEFNINYKIKNNAESSKDFVVIAAIFSDEDRFKFAKISDSATVTAGAIKNGTLVFTPSFTMKDGYYVKVFVIDNLKSIKPLSFSNSILKK